ncbi:MAG: nucleotidyltransferase domain-containing protein [Desulfamplus sp.]|nr:nucleotidyltransferase domain-containing protein [Desulfamplus sp.]
MVLKNNPIENNKLRLLLPEISKVIAEELGGNYRLFLFGSRATGRHHEKSDIDIGIMSDGLITAKQMQNIKDNLEDLPTLLKIDFVDFNSVGDEFRKMALSNAVIIK